MSAPVQQAPDPQAQQRRNIRVPELPEELQKDQYRNTTYTTSAVPPFLSTTESLVTERFNSDPNLLRSTLYVLPSSEYSLTASEIPFALVATPFSDRGPYESLPATPPRCPHCRAYFCCFTAAADASYVCNICGKQAATTQAGPDAQPIQSVLGYSSMEFTLPDAPGPALLAPVFVFVLDPGFQWFEQLSELLAAVCENEDFRFLYRRVIFILLSEGGLCAYAGSSRAGVVRVRMPGEVPPHLSSGVSVDTADSAVIRKILGGMMAARPSSADNMGRLLSIFRDLSSSFAAAKIALFSPLPTSRAGRTVNFEEFLTGTHSVSLNIFTGDKSDPSMNQLVFYTGGEVYAYRQADYPRFRVDLSALSVRRTVFDLSLVLKVSDNIEKTGVIAPSVEENYALTRLSAMTATSAVTFVLGLTGLSKNVKYVQLQSSFTDFDGTRRMRVLNHSFTVGNHASFFSGVAADTLFSVLCKMHASDELKLDDKLVRMLIFYRKKCSSAKAPESQFILPESIKLLPVLIQAFYKNARVSRTRLVSMSPEQTVRFFYPRLFALSDYSTVLRDTPCVRLSLSNIREDEIYVLENGCAIMVYVGREVDRELVGRLFGKDDCGRGLRAAADTEEGRLLGRVVGEIQEHYNYEMDVRVIQPGSPGEVDFLGYMIEDALNDVSDYIDFIFKIHFRVQKG